MDLSATQRALQLLFDSLASLAGSGPIAIEQRITLVFEEHREALFRYVTLVTRNPAVSEEIVQDAFLRLHQHFASGYRVDNVRGWLYKVAQNLAVDHGRATRETHSVDAEEQALCGRHNPEQHLLARERESRLALAVSRLPLLQRQCLLLRREGFRYREISEILGIGETTAVDHLSRAIHRLQKELHVPTAQ